jgi:TonB family protein
MVDISDDTNVIRRRAEVTSVVRRRHCSYEEKGRIVAEAITPGAVVADVARRHGGAPQIASSWETSVIKHLQHYKGYPSEALPRSEDCMVLLSFSLDRKGRVLAHHIARSSGCVDLDNDVMDMIMRAEPLPAFPANMPQAQLDLTVPIRFSMHFDANFAATLK